jgi:hypothetical protein
MMLSRAYKKVVDQGISCTYSNECENMVWDGGEREIAKYIEKDGMRGVQIQWEKSCGMWLLTKENIPHRKTIPNSLRLKSYLLQESAATVFVLIYKTPVPPPTSYNAKNDSYILKLYLDSKV